MSIHKIGSDLVRPTGPKSPTRISASSDDGGAEEGSRPARADRVEISSEGRALAALQVDSARPTQAEIQIRIGSGFYHQPEVAEEVARRIAESGDLFE